MAQPRSFNDPFDGALPVAPVSITPQIMRGHAELMVRRNFPSGTRISQIEMDALVQSMIDDFNSGEMQRRFNGGLNGGFRIVSFATGEDAGHNSLMWAHYSESHTGVCFEYESDDLELRDTLLRVDYASAGLEIDYWASSADDRFREMRRALTTKSAEWAYENEYRVIRVIDPPNDVAEFLTFPRRSLRVVRLGLNVSDVDRREMIEALNGYEVRPRLFQMERRPSEASLHEVEISA